MAKRKNRKKTKSGFRDIVSLISSLALLVIAILMVIFVVAYIRNNSLLGSLFGKKLPGITKEETREETVGAKDTDFTLDLDEGGLGLVRLAGGSLVYVLDENAAAAYEPEQLIKAEKTADGEQTYYLRDSWLDLEDNLYRFDAEGRACTEVFREGAFVFSYNADGILEKIRYNESYSEDAQSANPDFPGLCQTRTLWAFMGKDTVLGDYRTLMYKKTTDSLSYKLGGDTAQQYVSPYAFTVVGNRIYYLARKAAEGAGGNTVLANIGGKLFCMAPGADYREIAAENVEGFKILPLDEGTPVVYYYDGTGIHRSTTLKKDENMRVFAENAVYKLDISTLEKAYLLTEDGAKVTLQSDAFRVGNFTYTLAADGEILSVAKKDNVSLDGYTYTVENGEAFGQPICRVIRTNSSGDQEVISGEFPGKTGNLHYDTDLKCIVAEYTDRLDKGGLLRISPAGDVDIVTDAAGSNGTLTLIGLQDKKAYFKCTGDGKAKLSFASLAQTEPLTIGIDPFPISEMPEQESAAEDYDTANAGQLPVETGAGPQVSGNSNAGVAPGQAPGQGTSIGAGPGPGGDGASGNVIFEAPPAVEHVGPGGN